MNWFGGDPLAKARKAMAAARTMEEVRAAVQPYHLARPVDAIADLARLMFEFPDWAPILADEVQKIAEANPRLALRQRLYIPLSVTEARAVLDRQGHRWGVAAVFTLHSSGYVREEALLRLAEEPRGLPYILNRRSDWVAAVAQTAERLSAPGRAASYPVDRFGWQQAAAGAKRSRGPGSTYLRWLLDDPQRRLEGVVADPDIARYVLAQITHLSPDDPLVEAGLRSPHMAARSLIAQRLRPNGDAIEWATRLMADSAPGVRVSAILIAATEDPRHPIIGAARLDPNARVRAQARITYGADDHLAFYRSMLPSVGAIEGIGEVGKRADATDLLPFLDDPKPRIRWAAVRALASLDARETVPALKASLRDSSPRVVREAIRALDRLNANLNLGDLSLLLGNDAKADLVRLRATSLMSRWEEGLFLLRYGARADLQERAGALLSSWAYRLYRMPGHPPANFADEFGALLRDADWLPDEVRHKLASVLRVWQGEK